MEKTVKCYGMYIDAAEVLINIPHGKMDEFLKDLPVVGVYQDVDGQRQLFLFNKKQQANKACKKALDIGFTSAVLCPTLVYVPLKYVKDGEKN